MSDSDKGVDEWSRWLVMPVWQSSYLIVILLEYCNIIYIAFSVRDELVNEKVIPFLVYPLHFCLSLILSLSSIHQHGIRVPDLLVRENILYSCTTLLKLCNLSQMISPNHSCL